MRNKIFAAIISCFLTVLLLITGAVQISAVNDRNTVGDVQNVIDGIFAWNLNRIGAASVQDWIDGELTENAGVTSEWYILALRQSGEYDFSSYEAALLDYLENNKVSSASSRLKYALILHAVGSEDGYIKSTLDESIGGQGIMSWIYGLHLLNNGIISEKYTSSDVVQTLLSLRLDDGGWSLTGENSEVDISAMAVQALAPYYDEPLVKDAVDSALEFLSSQQREDGDYSNYGVENTESAAQVLTALSSVGIDCAEDERFIKNGSTLIDVIMKYQLDDGSFSHDDSGKYNHTSTVQALYSMVSYIRMTEGKSPLYIFEEYEPAETVLETKEETFTEAVESESAETMPAETEAIEAVTEETAPVESAEGSVHNSYKPWAVLVIVGIGAFACLILFLRGKRHVKNFIAVLLLCGIAVVIVFATDFQSAEDYYSGEDIVKENVIGTVTISIRCDTVAGKSDSEYIPEDGVILDAAEFAIAEGDSVYDILTEAAQKYHIQLENNGNSELAYIVGINYLYEFDFGDLSGWVYHVNGNTTSVGCGEYTLSDGDNIEWLYTCDLGEDVK